MKDIRPTATLQDVASLSGFSTATVSRCLNFPNQVSVATREKVQSAIEDLDYTPNFGARAMATQRTNTIGAVIPTMENAVFARGIQAFEEELDVCGYNLLVASSAYRADRELQQIKSLVARGADALLLIGHARDQAIYNLLASKNIPTIVTWAFDRSKSRPSIGFDNRLSMRMMAREVLSLGHRKLGLISAENASNDRAAARREGIYDAMREVGMMPQALTMIETVYSIEMGATSFEALMRGPNAPTAVFCGNDVLGVGAVGRARDMGLAVPRDVSIIGFDDIELAQVTFPKLATVHVPHIEMGKNAARALIQALRDGRPIKSQELVAALRLRDSLGPVPLSG